MLSRVDFGSNCREMMGLNFPRSPEGSIHPDADSAPISTNNEPIFSTILPYPINNIKFFLVTQQPNQADHPSKGVSAELMK